MSSARAKPDNSVANTASTTIASESSAAATDAATPWPATAAVPWAMTQMRATAPSVSRCTTSGGSASGPSDTLSRPPSSSSTILPRSVLRKDCGASKISFRRKWGKPGTVDVPGGDLRQANVLLVKRSRGGVIPHPPHPGERPGTGAVEHHDLAGGVFGSTLAVHRYVPRRLLDHAIELAGHDERVLGEAHVERLPPAAMQRQVQLVGGVGGAHGDRGGTVAARHGAAERVVQRVAFGDPAGHEHRQDLAVGRDLRRERERVGVAQVAVVVHVSVDGGDHVRVARVRQLVGEQPLAVERVGICLGDDAHAGPARMAEHGHLGVIARQGQVQDPDRCGSRPAARECCHPARRSRRRPCRRGSGGHAASAWRGT